MGLRSIIVVIFHVYPTSEFRSVIETDNIPTIFFLHCWILLEIGDSMCTHRHRWVYLHAQSQSQTQRQTHTLTQMSKYSVAHQHGAHAINESKSVVWRASAFASYTIRPIEIYTQIQLGARAWMCAHIVQCKQSVDGAWAGFPFQFFDQFSGGVANERTLFPYNEWKRPAGTDNHKRKRNI